MESVKVLFGNDNDFKIILGDYTWRVHADVIAGKSGLFRRICDGNNWKESNERAVTLHDDDPVMFARLLQFFYHDIYCYLRKDDFSSTPPYIRNYKRVPTIDDWLDSGFNGPSPSEGDESDLDTIRLPVIDLGVYNLADKYDIPSLKKISLRSCTMNVHGEIPNPNLSLIRDLFTRYYPDRVNQDPELKEVVAELIASYFGEIRADEYEWTNGMGRWLKDDFELCTMVMDKREASRLLEEENYQCISCENRW